MNENVTPRRRSLEPGSLIGGLVLVTLGILFLLDEFNVADFGDVVRVYWPMIIIAVGATKLGLRRSFWAGLWLIAVGTWLQLVTARLFGLTYANSWPLILIALGAGIILKTLVEAARASREPHEP